MSARPENQVERKAGQTHRRLIGVSLLPAAATLGNLLCGFAAVFCCLLSVRAEYAQEVYNVQPRVFFSRLESVLPTHIATGAYLIVLAMIFDALDGRLARMTRRTSEFGAQLDSLSDIVSFGVAPAALCITLLMRPAPGADANEPDVSRLEFRVGMVCALVYLSCAAIRLARYNAENVKSEEGQRAFSGLPSPGAAAAVAALLALHEHLRHLDYRLWGVNWADVSRWVIAATAFAVGLLMVSRFDYVHVFNVYIRRRHPPTHLVWLIVILGLGFYSFELLLVVLAFGYVISGMVVGVARWLRGKDDVVPLVGSADGDGDKPAGAAGG
jgi:CDP-diacylglycerol--serine O-phosphatidyltransferase